MDETAIERELADAQAAFLAGTRELRKRRQDAVMAARAVEMSKYKIAAVMGIKGPTVDSIISAAKREAESDE
jgi:DNA-directed RNA polymerase specialized sigma24 family protein